jgi:hypothetical protein
VATPLVMRAVSGTAETEPLAETVIERRGASSAEAADAISAGTSRTGKT